MAEDILQIHHSNFKYVKISCDINDPIEELQFEGTENSFQQNLKAYFRRIVFNEEGKQELKETIKEKLKTTDHTNDNESNEKDNTLVSQDILNNAVNYVQTYQIIPLVLPSPNSNYLGVNCYIDDVGRIKKLPFNSRASRICSTDIFGDAFISKTFDNDDFKRCDFTIKEYEEFLQNPPSSKNRWNQEEAMQNFLKQMSAGQNTQNTQGEISNEYANEIKKASCENCYKEENLKRCGRCKKVYYCSVECQKKDYTFHRRICS